MPTVAMGGASASVGLGVKEIESSSRTGRSGGYEMLNGAIYRELSVAWQMQTLGSKGIDIQKPISILAKQ